MASALTCGGIQPSVSDEVTPQTSTGSLWTEGGLVADLSVRLVIGQNTVYSLRKKKKKKHEAADKIKPNETCSRAAMHRV